MYIILYTYYIGLEYKTYHLCIINKCVSLINKNKNNIINK